MWAFHLAAARRCLTLQKIRPLNRQKRQTRNFEKQTTALNVSDTFQPLENQRYKDKTLSERSLAELRDILADKLW